MLTLALALALTLALALALAPRLDGAQEGGELLRVRLLAVDPLDACVLDHDPPLYLTYISPISSLYLAWMHAYSTMILRRRTC